MQLKPRRARCNLSNKQNRHMVLKESCAYFGWCPIYCWIAMCLKRVMLYIVQYDRTASGNCRCFACLTQRNHFQLRYTTALRTPVRWCRHSAGHGALISASWCTLSAEDGAPVPFPVVHGGRGRWCTAAMLGLYF